MMTELPCGWNNHLLSELLQSLESGSRPRGGVRGIVSGVPSIGGEHLNYDGTFSFGNIKYVPDDFAERMNKGHIKTGDVLVVKDGATTGKVSYVGNEFPYDKAVVNEHVFICRAKPSINSKFVFRYLMSQAGQQQILENFRGAAQGGINTTFIDNVTIPIPSDVATQNRIVDKLDHLLNRVRSTQERLDKIPGIIKRFRQSVLSAACSGRLTEHWRRENQCVKWENKLLQDICSKIVDCPHSTPQWTDEGKICIRTSNFRIGRLDLSEVRYVSTATFNERNLRLTPEAHDILYSREGGILGIACQVPENIELCLGQRMMLLRVSENVSANYIMNVLNAPLITDTVKEKVGGTAAPHLNVGDVKKFEIPLPSLPEQQEIVRRVQSLFKFADKMEQRYLKAKAHTDKLTQSILAKAFRGEL